MPGCLTLQAAATRKYIIISSSGDGNMSDNLEIAAQFISNGYHVMLYDYRGYGKSGDFKINNDFFIYPQFVKDLQAACDYAHNHFTMPSSTFMVLALEQVYL